jgi:hypothetical protein
MFPAGIPLVGDVGEDGGAAGGDAAFGDEDEEACEELADAVRRVELGELGKEVGGESLRSRRRSSRGLEDGEALGEGLGAAEAFGFDGFGGGEFAVHVGFGTRGTGMEEAAVPNGDATGGTGYGRKLCRGQVFHTHEERIRQKIWESSPVWNTLERIFSAGTWRAGRVRGLE